MNKIKIKTVLSSSNFIKEIEKLVIEKRLSYMDAIVYFCEKNSIEIETAASLIKMSTKMKSKLQTEAKALHLLK